MDSIISSSLHDSMSYDEYRALVSRLLAQNRTTGPIQTEDYVHYTKMNEVRMTRLDKTVKIQEEYSDLLRSTNQSQIWLIITEAWCGDAAQVIPVIEKMAALNENIETRYVLRDENLELMNLFLTNGGKSIPKVIVIDKGQEEVLLDWGPRPKEVQAMVEARAKEESPEPYMKFAVKLQKWYANDRTLSTQREFAEGYMIGVDL
jgi:hypothetical protein